MTCVCLAIRTYFIVNPNYAIIYQTTTTLRIVCVCFILIQQYVFHIYNKTSVKRYFRRLERGGLPIDQLTEKTEKQFPSKNTSYLNTCINVYMYCLILDTALHTDISAQTRLPSIMEQATRNVMGTKTASWTAQVLSAPESMNQVV